ncbi:MAG: hypothetical protein IKJ07_09185 [Clostridia bacterium]|nr:hypothetical protein [Clostridia bacterium]
MAEKGRFFEWQSPRERNRAMSEGGANGWRQQCDGTLAFLENLSTVRVSVNKKIP